MRLPVILSLRGPRARGIQFMSKALSFEIPATMDSSEVETIELISSVGEEPETVTAVSSRYIQALDRKEQLERELAHTRHVLARFICNV